MLRRFPVLILAMVLSTLIGLPVQPVAQAAEWQWSAPDGQARAYLWIPADCRRVRAVVVANHNMIEQGILEHPAMRRALTELGMAQVWVVPAMDGVFDFNKGAAEHFQRIMDALAEVSGYGELKFAPVVPMGHSACATFPWNFAAWNPQRTLAILSVHGDAPQTSRTGYGRANIDWGGRNIDGVPGLMVMGEYEWSEDRLEPAFDFLAKHPRTAMAFLGDAGRGHFDFSDEMISFVAMFLRKAAAARLPAEAPLDGPVDLKPVDPKVGWRIDRWRKDQPPQAKAAPFAQYRGDPKQAFWCFDEEMAGETEARYARVRGKQSQLLSVTDTAAPAQSGCGEPVTPKFIPLADGISFKLKTAFMDAVPGDAKNTNPARWAALPVGTALGHAGADKPIVLSRIVGPVVQTAADIFAIHPGRAEFTSNGRNNDMWILASHSGDQRYKSAVQQAVVKAVPNSRGAPQVIDFPAIADQPAGARSIQLKGTSDAGLHVSYYVVEGPVEIAGDKLTFTPIPPRSRFPVKVTVVAWQWGRPFEPLVQTAAQQQRSFNILK